MTRVSTVNNKTSTSSGMSSLISPNEKAAAKSPKNGSAPDLKQNTKSSSGNDLDSAINSTSGLNNNFDVYSKKADDSNNVHVEKLEKRNQKLKETVSSLKMTLKVMKEENKILRSEHHK